MPLPPQTLPHDAPNPPTLPHDAPKPPTFPVLQSLCSAELRLYQQGQSTRQNQRVEVLLRGQYVLDSKRLGQNVRGWKNFNVYDAFIDDNSLPEVSCATLVSRDSVPRV